MIGVTHSFANLNISKSPPAEEPRSSLPSIIPSVCEDESEQPIDFSKKYCETKLPKHCTFNNVVKSYNRFSMYAETDLDQPTDYSLRYAEDASELDTSNKISKTEFIQDTIKTYCTEDTPYETPFNFSTSTSMSDLRIDNKCKNTKEVNNVQNKVKSEFSSGLMSPEKPVNYCEEGTPGCFSRVASCGSLNSVNEILKQESKEKTEIAKKVNKFATEPKVVKFEEVVNYAEETPLMFSRSSSLGSLDSIEQHSIHDDRSSVVSDFSRLTSGVISPSELPDSPSQTIPPSPRLKKSLLIFPSVNKKLEETKTESIINPRLLDQKNDVSSDSLRTYCTEGTPALLSQAGSHTDLSILSINLEESLDKNILESNQLEIVEKNKSTEEETNQSRRSSFSSLSDASHESEEALLEECILAGMPKSNSVTKLTKVCSDLEEKKAESEESSDDEDILEDCIKLGIENKRYAQSQAKSYKSMTDDTIKSYFTEDTPAVLSHVGSSSHLSVLSSQDAEDSAKDNFSDVSDEDEDRLLEECVKFGMAAIAKKNKIDKNDEDLEVMSSASVSSLDSNESEQALLQQCIQAGMPKRTQDTGDLTPSEKLLLQQCIIEGMKKCRSGQITSQKPSEDDSSELTQAEQALLRQCILSGMPKNKNNIQGGASKLRESSGLTETERILLQQCILAGMPKSRTKKENLGSRRWGKKPKELEEHTCCIHCPKNKAGRQQNVKVEKGKKKYREKIKESRDVNVVFVSNHQVLTVKKEMINRTHEKWV